MKIHGRTYGNDIKHGALLSLFFCFEYILNSYVLYGINWTLRYNIENIATRYVLHKSLVVGTKVYHCIDMYLYVIATGTNGTCA